MLDTAMREAVARLAAAVQSLRPVVERLPTPVRVVPVGHHATNWSTEQCLAAARLVDRISDQLGITGLTLTRHVEFDELQVFERVVSERLALAEQAAWPPDPTGELDRIITASLDDGFERFCRRDTVMSVDGVPLSAYSAGAAEETVVVVPACGMPAALIEPWVRYLAVDRRVLVWESRGLFGAVDELGDFTVSTAAQVSDLCQVMAYYDVPRAHVIGLCGGAVIALAAAAARPDLIATLGLWHGAYEFADGCPKTTHQRNLVDLMGLAAASPTAAAAVHAAFCQVMLTGVPEGLAHLLLYPYANANLLYQYCRLNSAITSTDVGQYLPTVAQPALVVTSQDDDIAHPDASRRVADGLPAGQLRVAEHGNHISLFSADVPLMRVAVDFMARHTTAARATEA
ncbi:MAG TPA: alpha/beta hydrolase [Pseudonocardiaceae bacterium]|jgi:pimeloyl-ACP methyl ester carboxylesterase